MTLPNLLKQLKDAESKASPGPWRVDARDVRFHTQYGGKEICHESAMDYGNWWCLGAEIVGPADVSRGTFGVLDAWLIVLLRNNIREIIAALEGK